MKQLHPQTKLLRSAIGDDGAISPPLQRGSTILMQNAEHLYDADKRTYGISGLDTHDALRTALCELEGADHCLLAPSGLLACTLPMLALTEPGAHILVSDGVYGPTRRFCDRSLRRLGVATEYFDPAAGAEIVDLIRPNTRLIFMESPASLTFEISDTPAIAQIAREREVITAVDNTWSAGTFFHPLQHGVDIVIQATTKYPSGHSDVMSGAILTGNAELAERIDAMAADIGLCVAAEDAWLILRGLKTMHVRLEKHQSSAMEIAAWMAEQPMVRRVLYPALPGDPAHHLWKRDFTGAAGMFSFIPDTNAPGAALTFINELRLFGKGFSWGGYGSLAIHCDPQLACRSKQPDGQLIRLHIGLEDTEDLKADLDAALKYIASGKNMDKSAGGV